MENWIVGSDAVAMRRNECLPKTTSRNGSPTRTASRALAVPASESGRYSATRNVFCAATPTVTETPRGNGR